MNEPINYLEDLFESEAELLAYQLTYFPFNLPLIKTALDKRLEEDPDYEVFIPVEYYKDKKRAKYPSENMKMTIYKWFVSNKGRVYSKRQGEGKFITPSVNLSGYPQLVTTIRINRKIINQTMVIHRLLACCFIPVPEKLKLIFPTELEVNHIDGDKTNFALSNLEWVTGLENHEHALDTGLRACAEFHEETKPVKGTVIKGKFKGLEFVIFGGRELEKHGFDQGAVSNVVAGKLGSHKSCSFCFATEEDIKNLPRGISEEVKKDLQSIIPWAKYIIVGTHMETGEKVEAVGDVMLRKLGFTPSGVRNCLAGISKSHKGYTWEKVYPEQQAA